jgi:hypothetical protein
MIQEALARLRKLFQSSRPASTVEPETSTRTSSVPRTQKRGVVSERLAPGRHRISVPAGTDPTSAFEDALMSSAMALLQEAKAQDDADADLLSELDDEQPPPSDGTRERTLERRHWHLARVAASRVEYEDLCFNEGIRPRDDWQPKRSRALAKRRAREARSEYTTSNPLARFFGRMTAQK